MWASMLQNVVRPLNASVFAVLDLSVSHGASPTAGGVAHALAQLGALEALVFSPASAHGQRIAWPAGVHLARDAAALLVPALLPVPTTMGGAHPAKCGADQTVANGGKKKTQRPTTRLRDLGVLRGVF